MAALPDAVQQELRATMCEATFGRVMGILDRWLEGVQVTPVWSHARRTLSLVVDDLDRRDDLDML
jgi:hypothetical protein